MSKLKRMTSDGYLYCIRGRKGMGCRWNTYLAHWHPIINGKIVWSTKITEKAFKKGNS